jgi:hypothetical protein
MRQSASGPMRPVVDVVMPPMTRRTDEIAYAAP